MVFVVAVGYRAEGPNDGSRAREGPEHILSPPRAPAGRQNRTFAHHRFCHPSGALFIHSLPFDPPGPGYHLAGPAGLSNDNVNDHGDMLSLPWSLTLLITDH